MLDSLTTILGAAWRGFPQCRRPKLGQRVSPTGEKTRAFSPSNLVHIGNVGKNFFFKFNFTALISYHALEKKKFVIQLKANLNTTMAYFCYLMKQIFLLISKL
uniref:Uncharacterized protein n=1 Tax=Cacopsylla melanoneura TaxID=428564 RepID=A0A8D8RBQ5_9HEMI